MPNTPFPDLTSQNEQANFATAVVDRPEFRALRVPSLPTNSFPNVESFTKAVSAKCNAFEKYLYQYVAVQYLAARTPYRSMLLFHGLGTGKTCSAITVAEAFLKHHRTGAAAPIWVVASPALQASFINEVHRASTTSTNTCTGNAYLNYFPNAARLEPAVLKRKMRAFIASRYKFWTYEGLANALAANPEPFHDKVVIIDEAHNLRGDGQRLHEQLMTLLPRGTGNRLVLLSATPMFNEPNEIFGAFRLLLANDHRADPISATNVPNAPDKLFRTAKQRNLPAFAVVERLSQEYVSYVRGANPFTFAPRLSPSRSGVPLLQNREWAAPIKDGLVPTPLGALQKAWWLPRRPKYAKTAAQQAENAIMSAQSQLMQGTNIVYPISSTETLPGRAGFFQVFKSQEAAGNTSLQVEYLQPAAPWLQPGPRLQSCGAKLDRIVNFILNARGIVMVYSEFVWAGVVPLAIALEHAGFSRYGENNMLAGQGGPRARAAGSYAILSGTSDVMGRKSFTELLETINNPNNKSGSKVKVVLLTQVASEGLTLKNVREVHIVEPWYHFNQLEQVIGRAVRTCSHEALPVQERNVTVYLHCAVAEAEATGAPTPDAKPGAPTPDAKPGAPTTDAKPGVAPTPDAKPGVVPTPDEHAYEIAARKLGQIELVEKALRDNAVDCALNINVNYVPPTTFGFKVMLNTSQGAQVEWTFGDAADMKPKCKSAINLHAVDSGQSAASSVRHLEAVMPTALARIRAHLHSLPHGTRVPVADLVEASKLPSAFAMTAIMRLVGSQERANATTATIVRLHDDFVILQKITKREKGRLIEIPEAADAPPRPVASTSAAPTATPIAAAATAATAAPAAAPSTSAHALRASYTQLLSMLPADDAQAKFTLYSMLTRASFFQLAKDVVAGVVAPNEHANRAVRLLDTEGVWIKERNNRLTGFINIFTPRATFEVYLGQEKASNAQTETLRAARIFQDVPMSAKDTKDTIGYFALKRDRAAAGDDVQLAFQLLMPNSLPGNQRGAFCETKSKGELKTLITALTPDYFDRVKPSKDFEIRKTLCVIIGSELQKHGQLMLPPFYKPKSSS